MTVTVELEQGQGERCRKVLLKMVVCMMMELALNEDINKAEEGETTNCYLVFMESVFS